MLNLTGNITLPNVEPNESITVTDGSLTILDDVGSGARITLVSSQSPIGNVFINNRNTGHKLIVQGNVHDRANITGSSNMEFRGYLSDHIKVNTQQGSIIVKGNVGSNTSLKSISGDVSVRSHDPSATITTIFGKCYVNGIRSEIRRENRSNSSTNNFFGSKMHVVNTNTIIGRLFRDGVEQRTTPSQPQNSHASADTMPKI